MIEGLFREGKSFALFPFRVFYSPLAAGEGSVPVHEEPVPIAGKEAISVPNNRISGEEESGDRGSAVIARLQAGFGASSRNFKKAVDRNRIKRLTREAYRLQKNALRQRLEETDRSLAVFIIYTGKELPEYDTVTKKMGLILQKLLKETEG